MTEKNQSSFYESIDEWEQKKFLQFNDTAQVYIKTVEVSIMLNDISITEVESC